MKQSSFKSTLDLGQSGVRPHGVDREGEMEDTSFTATRPAEVDSTGIEFEMAGSPESGCERSEAELPVSLPTCSEMGQPETRRSSELSAHHDAAELYGESSIYKGRRTDPNDSFSSLDYAAALSDIVSPISQPHSTTSTGVSPIMTATHFQISEISRDLMGSISTLSLPQSVCDDSFRDECNSTNVSPAIVDEQSCQNPGLHDLKCKCSYMANLQEHYLTSVV